MHGRIKRSVMFFILVLAALFLGVLFYRKFSDYRMSSLEYQGLRDRFSVIHEDLGSDVSDGDEDAVKEKDPCRFSFPDISIDHEGLLDKNQDYAAWLYYPDGNIDLPVVQEPEGKFGYYSHRTFEGTSRSAGCVYASSEIRLDSGRGNVFLFGHNMADGSMFGTLKQLYRDKKEITDPYFYLFMKDGTKRQFRILSMHVVHCEDYDFYDSPGTPDAYDVYMKRVLSSDEKGILEKFPLSDYEQRCIDVRSQIVTLYTCFGRAGTDRRLYVQGVETYVEKE